MEVKTILSVRDSEGNIVDIPAIKGKKGDKGEKGNSPVKGQDYWTETDKEEIVDDVRNEFPHNLSELVNDTNYITSAVSNLTNYYLKSDLYTKSEVADLISAIQTVSIEVVNTLPTSNQKTNVIYFVSKTGETNDVYDEYVWINNSWEHIGSTDVDLNGYVTISDFEDEQSEREDADNRLRTKINLIQSDIERMPNGLRYDNNYLYLTVDGDVVSDGVRIINGGGSGGSGGTGGGVNNNAELTLQNTTGWLTYTTTPDTHCILSFNWSSLEDGLSTGTGVLTVLVNDVMKVNKNIEQGVFSVDVKDLISLGENVVKVKVTDVYGNTKIMNFTISVLDLRITSTFDNSIAYMGSILFTYTPIGNLEKLVHFFVDGTEVGTDTIVTSGRQQSYTFDAQSHGSHNLQIYYTSTINGAEVQSNVLNYDIICLNSDSTSSIIASDFEKTTAQRYETLKIEYFVYTPSMFNTAVQLIANDEVVQSIIVDRTKHTWSYRIDTPGTLTLKIVTEDSTSKTFVLEVADGDINVQAETNDLVLYLSAQNRSNNEANPATWSYKDINCDFSGFNFISDGWQLDSNGESVLRIANGAVLTIPYKIFQEDFRTKGKTIEFEFSTHDVLNYDSVVFSCFNDNRGLKISAQKALFNSEQSSITTQYKEDERVRLAFVIEKRAENRLVYCYINGIISSIMQYSDVDDFSQLRPVDITLGSNDCTLDVYTIRIYDNSLTRYQMIDNWIYDMGNIEYKLETYEANEIFDDYGNIIISKLPKYLPYLVLQSAELPQYKGDKKTCQGYYVDATYPEYSFSFSNAQIDVQGTSSQYYKRKNYKVKFKGGFVYSDGTGSDEYKMNENAIATNTFVFKADVASSEGCNNVELVKLYNDICPYKTPPQVTNPKFRQGIDGFPIVVFWDNGTETSFLGKYNFNNDKGTPEVYGFNDGDESWEVLNNTSNRVLWKSDDFSDDSWQQDFEGRYPDGNVDITNLQILSSWIKSTDTTQATNETLLSPVIYEGVTYTNDTAEYRLAKFKNEFEQYFEKDSAIFYYLFTELFLMVDSRAKNMFPSRFGGDT